MATMTSSGVQRRLTECDLEKIGFATNLAEPLHAQKLENALRLAPLLHYVQGVMDPQLHSDLETDTDTDVTRDSATDEEGNRIYNGIVVTKSERKADKSRLYNVSRIKKSRKWIKNLLLSDSSSDEDDEIGQDYLNGLICVHKWQRRYQLKFYRNKECAQYQYYSVGLLSNDDHFPDHQRSILGPRKISKEQRKHEKKMKAKLKKLKDKVKYEGQVSILHGMMIQGRHKTKKLTPEQIAVRRRKMWVMIAKKEIPKAQKQKLSARKEILSKLKKLAKDSQRECKQGAVQSQKIMKEAPARARRLCREMQVYWKRFEKVEKEHRKRAEKEAQEQRKMDLEIREMKRQQRKLNFLITQTELYAHFMARKMTGEREVRQKEILDRLEETSGSFSDLTERAVEGGTLTDINGDAYDSAAMKSLALRNAQLAYQEHVAKKNSYDSGHHAIKARFHQEAYSSLANPDMTSTTDQPQPTMFTGKLKGYQLKGMNWLVNLYNQGINGILADEMGLGKTVQSIAFLTHLAEYEGIWGPFLVVAPASTLHNWQQEVSRFNTKFKVVPYWGNTQDRKILRKFWNQENINTEDASFHVVITSYQLVIQDVKYFQRIKWHYMILDEAQALKSSSSVRWKILLGFSCRNRLLLTGTPIQNSMAELWALLHFIMPTMFDSHDEFNEWFSKDIESHVEKQSMIDEDQLSRLHMILKPFMLRRVKKDVENELSDKIEILVYCPLTRRQKLLYQAIKNKISIEDLLQSSSGSSTQQTQSSTSSLMNLVMQFRKVCNHPELFERREVRSSFHMHSEPFISPKLLYREGISSTAVPIKKKLLYNHLYIFHPENIYKSIFSSEHHAQIGGCFSFTRFINMAPCELCFVMSADLLGRWLSLFLWWKEASWIAHNCIWETDHQPDRYLGRRSLLLTPLQTIYDSNLHTSIVLRNLVFTSHSSSMYTHRVHHMHYVPETLAHRKIRCRKFMRKLHQIGSTTHKPTLSPPHSPTKPLLQFTKHKAKGQYYSSLKQVDILDVSDLPVHKHIQRPSKKIEDVPTDMPACFYNLIPPAIASPRVLYCADRSAEWERSTSCHDPCARNSLLYGSPSIAEEVESSKYNFFPSLPGGLYGLQPKNGFSCVLVPDKETFVSDAGKLYVLDTLLGRLKDDGHRVLIYSQMTRMIDLLEEYMIHRKHTYMRLDGSSKISDRRDMVADFQTRSDIFVFLLSTRAGGLGINLTAADTVIFYDSDWNPTVDQQAMDRAHRLGQTKQVTVYRLICKGTIEERILQRAKEKSEIQRMVISGGNYRPDSLKPKEVVSLLLDDDEMERKLRQKQEEKVRREELDKLRKRDKYYNQKKSATASPCVTPVPGREVRTPKKRGRPPKKKKVPTATLR